MHEFVWFKKQPSATMLNNYRNGTIVIFSQLQTNGTCTLKCENGPICEKVAKCETKSTLNVKIDAIEPLTHLATFSHIATFSQFEGATHV